MKYSRLPCLAALVAALLLINGCARKRDYIPVNKDSLKASGKLYLTPLGEFPLEPVQDLAVFYRKKYNVDVEVLPSVPLSPAAMNPERNQLIAEQAIEILKQARPELKDNPRAVLIGITEEDMYISKYDWQFSFSYRDQGKYAVVSSGRMHLPSGRKEVTEELIFTRLRKMVTKNVGILYYRLSQSDDPRSVLYRNVGGIRELDYMGEEF